MSEQAPERTTGGGGGGGNVFTRKVGPLSLWVWMLIALVIAIAYYMYKKNSSSASNSSTANAAAGNAPGGVDSSLVPQFINQTYVDSQPPVQPNITVNNQLPTPPVGGTQPSPPPVQTQPNKPTPKPVPVSKYPAPTGLKVNKVSGTSLKATWKNITGAQPPSSYTVAVYNSGGKLVDQQTVNAPDTTGGNSTVTLTGLPSNAKNLQVHVWANGGSLAPPHAASTLSL